MIPHIVLSTSVYACSIGYLKQTSKNSCNCAVYDEQKIVSKLDVLAASKLQDVGVDVNPRLPNLDFTILIMGFTHVCPASTLFFFFSSPLADTKATSFMAHEH